jgi:hypothetical protein
MKAISGIGVALGLAAWASGCTLGGSCREGQTQACACPSGAEGAQVCASDGTYGTCKCGDADAGPTSDAGPVAQCATSCEASSGAGCNALSQQGGCVTTTVQAEGGAAFTGGEIAPGTYVLDSMTFVSTPPTEFTFAMTLQVTRTAASAYDFELLRSDTACPGARLSYTFTTQGGRYSLAETCPNPGCDDAVSCGESSEFQVEGPCRFTLHGGFGYLQALHFVNAGACP